MYISNIVYRW